MTALTETRKADRLKIATQVCNLLDRLKIDHAWTREGFVEGYPKAHRISVNAPRGLDLGIKIDGESCQPNVYVLCWHISSKVDTCLADRFGDINPHHFSKLTAVAYGLDGLLSHLEQKLLMALDGSAFDDERETAAIAKNGTAADRNARFAQWCAEETAKREAARVSA
ncbi:hypothetical protein OEG84_11545 [Hoeflea sp. G2-23]|uniref:Uncharacterized protein n=1 Tax=Hoeflea algicola TaxID=2983763 RepID=A0ABT3Z965_9HYPH|nr:hypothetical protein [Hoeflea algicola]MCY0148327.1 hypothetical protein [Hoeflea algicola]